MSCDGRKDGRLCNSKAVKSEFIDRFEKDFGVNPKRQSSIKVQGGKQRTVSRERVEKMADGVSLYKQKSLMKNRCWEKNRRIHSRAKTCDTFIKQYVEPIGNTVYQFTVRDLAGEEVSLGRYQGMPLLIVNMASNDLQYTEKNLVHLNRLYLNYHQYQFHIAAFPTNDVAREPLNEMELVDFILKNDIRYDVYAKVDVLGSPGGLI